jgi:isopentenyldiphosphate isomerase
VSELFDIVDTDDRVIGQATREQVHGNPDLLHRVAHVLVFDSSGRLFLQKRSSAKEVQPGKWDTSVGGHVEAGEAYEESARREMAEELGVRDVSLERLYRYIHRNSYESEYVTTFCCVYDGAMELNRAEIERGAFWSLAEIEDAAERGVFTPNFLDELARYRRYRSEAAPASEPREDGARDEPASSGRESAS